MQNPDIIINDMCICTGREEMQIPTGVTHVRQLTISLRKFIGIPVVTATVESPDSNGTMFCLWNINIVDQPNQTSIKFSAANVLFRQPSDFKYFVSYYVTGKIKWISFRNRDAANMGLPRAEPDQLSSSLFPSVIWLSSLLSEASRLCRSSKGAFFMSAFAAWIAGIPHEDEFPNIYWTRPETCPENFS